MKKEEQVIKGFGDILNKIVSLNKSKMQADLKGYNPSEIHCIGCISRNVDSNVTKLSEAFYMTRGALSKLTKKLIKKGIIESYQKPDNKFIMLNKMKVKKYRRYKRTTSFKEFVKRGKREFQRRSC